MEYFILILLVAITPWLLFRENGPVDRRRQSKLEQEDYLTSKMAATVLSKHQSTDGYVHDGHGGIYTENFITFELQNGERLVFDVNDNAYGSVLEGERVTLTLKQTKRGYKLLDFVRNKN